METSQIYYINSRYRTSGTDSNFSVNLEIDSNNEFNSIALLSISIPKSFYNISQYSNKMNVLNEDNLMGSRLITIPPANYNRKTLSNTLITLLNNNPQNFIYNVTYSSSNVADTGKFSFSVSNNSSVQPIYQFNIYSCWEVLGFTKANYSFTSNSLTSVNVMNFNFENTFYLYSNSCQDRSNILQSIYTAQTENNSYITWTNDNPLLNSKQYINSSCNSFNFFLLNEDDLPVDLNGLNLNMSIILFQKSKTNKMVQNYIKYNLLKDE